MNKVFLTLVLFVFANITVFSEELTQTIRGEVIAEETNRGLAGVNVFLKDTKLGGRTNSKGEFKIEKVPIGRYLLIASMLGRQSYTNNIIVNSGKESIFKIILKEKLISTDSLVITARRDNFISINESALISSTVFSIDDVNRYAGSRGDPARMVQNYAGVLSANDNRNDIIIRGGSPTELLWILDGLEIPNPNHFATQGATGGPINAINTNLLDNSDFLTGAFPSNYYGKLSGVFDLKTRKGNDENYEFTGQFGFNGFELGAEGPIQQDNSSFIASYRYSFLGLLKDMGMDFGVSGIPEYQDGTIKLDFDINETNKLSFTSLFGFSNIAIYDSEEDDVTTGDFDTKNGTDIYAAVINWTNLINDNSFGVLTGGITYSAFKTSEDSLTVTDGNISKYKWFDSNSGEGQFSIKYNYFNKLSQSINLKIGAEYKNIFYNLKDSRFDPNIPETDLYRIDETGNSSLFAGNISAEYKGIPNLEIVPGVASQYFTLNKQTTIEPRIGIKYSLSDYQFINAGFGINNQLPPLMVFFANPENKELKFMTSYHYILGYAYQFSSDFQVKIEGYYKYLNNIPVEKDTLNTWSFINSGANYGAVSYKSDPLESTGQGKTYGCELSLMKHFANNYYFTIAASYIRMEYLASDKVWRFGAFDNLFVINILSGYDWQITDDFSIEFSGKYTNAGGNPYTPIDLQRSIEANDTKRDYSNAFGFRNPNYDRFDVRVDFRMNFVGFSISSYLSLENALGTKNVLSRKFRSSTQSIKESYQMGRFFIGGIKINF